MISLSSDLQIRYDGGDHLENCMFNRSVLSAYGLWLVVYFDLWLLVDRHLENIFRLDLFHAGTSVILTGIFFSWINNSNGDDNDITSSSSRTTTTITTTKVRNY